MNGCYMTGYQPGDYCYQFKREVTKCIEQMDAANFIGVGFDGRGGNQIFNSKSEPWSIQLHTCHV